MCHLLTPPLPPLRGGRNGGRKGYDYGIRIISWKQQPDKKVNSNNSTTNVRGYKKRNIIGHPVENPWQ